MRLRADWATGSGTQQFDFERAEIAILSSWRISVRLEA